MPAASAPSPWIVRWQHLLPAGGRVLDVACGTGRHTRWLQQSGHRVTGVDRSPEALAGMASLAATGVELVEADLEADGWPFASRFFDAVVVTNYLWRPLLPDIVAAVAPGGVLLYETFASGNETVGRPARSDFLLQPGELLSACGGLHIVAFENGFLEGPPRFVQRIAAVRLDPTDSIHAAPPRHALESDVDPSQIP
jgi:SAM-dependent methyltransferase